MVKGSIFWRLLITVLLLILIGGFSLQQKTEYGGSAAAEELQPAVSVVSAYFSSGALPTAGKIALTFDDGPSAVYTPTLLEGLKERGVKATFFITGKNAERFPELVKQMHEEGHLIGNHTYSHLQLTKSNRDKFQEELVRTGEIISGITGEEVVYVRPPYGSWDKSFEKELNLLPVLWTIDPLDWCTQNASEVVKKVISRAKENAVILLHDEYASSVAAALQIVDELQKKGYEFVTVEEILFD